MKKIIFSLTAAFFVICGIIYFPQLQRKHTPKVSVAVIIYNRINYIEECLESILKQNIDKEIILADDHSTDGTFEYLQRFQEKHPEVKLYQTPQNSGTVINRYNAMKHATGDYLIFVDADDALIPESLPKLYKMARNQKADILEFDIASDDEKQSYRPLKLQNAAKFENNILESYDNRFISNSLANKLFSKKLYTTVLSKINPKIKQPNFSDVVFYLYHFLLNAENVVQSDIVGYFYYTRRGMTSRLSNVDALKNYVGFAVTKKEIEKVYGPLESLEKTYRTACNQALNEYTLLSAEDKKTYLPELYKLMSKDRVEQYLRENEDEKQ
jgi:glycosyltransferase involved in cell wall biosynthesis